MYTTFDTKINECPRRKSSIKKIRNFKTPENLNQYMDHFHVDHPQFPCTTVPWALALGHQSMKIPRHPHHTIPHLVPEDVQVIQIQKQDSGTT